MSQLTDFGSNSNPQIALLRHHGLGHTGFSSTITCIFLVILATLNKTVGSWSTKPSSCDVAVERQVEITGPDAAKFVQMLTPRDLSKMSVGQCKYILITNADGGILNDPILLRLAENHFWISLADSDILLWAQGVAIHSGMDVHIREPDVSPCNCRDQSRA